MTKHTEVMKLALEALEIERSVPRLGPVPTKTSKAITALREALTSIPDWASEAKEQPAQRQARSADTWVSLTDEDIEFLRHELVIGRNDIKAIEAKLREKNSD